MSLQDEADKIMAEQIMKEEYRNQHFVPQFSLVQPYSKRLKSAAEEGLLIFTKYALVLALAFLALQFGTSIISGSTNGTQAALYLNELQNKGWLPKVVNGVIPQKPEASNETK